MALFAFLQEELDSMRIDQEGHMMDTCAIITVEEGALNEFNEADSPNPTEQEAIDCGLDMRPSDRSSDERHTGQMTIVQYDATIRLPITTVVKETNQVKILTRFGETVDNLVYEIVSPIQRGPSGIRLRLRKVVI